MSTSNAKTVNIDASVVGVIGVLTFIFNAFHSHWLMSFVHFSVLAFYVLFMLGFVLINVNIPKIVESLLDDPEKLKYFKGGVKNKFFNLNSFLCGVQVGISIWQGWAISAIIVTAAFLTLFVVMNRVNKIVNNLKMNYANELSNTEKGE